MKTSSSAKDELQQDGGTITGATLQETNLALLSLAAALATNILPQPEGL